MNESNSVISVLNVLYAAAVFKFFQIYKHYQMKNNDYLDLLLKINDLMLVKPLKLMNDFMNE